MSGELSFEQKVKGAKPAEGTVDVCLRGDLLAEFEALEAQLAAALQDTSGDERKVGNPDARRLAAAIEELRAEMQRSVQTFRLRAFSSGRYTAMMGDYPPAADKEQHVALGYNPDAFFPDALRKSIVDPARISDKTWETFLASIGDGDYNKLVAKMQQLNGRAVSIPKSRAALILIQGGGSESKPPEA